MSEELLLGNRNFRVLIDGIEVGVCEISRLTSGADPPAEGGAGACPEARITLRRALTDSKELYRWREQILAGRLDHRKVVIEQHDRAGERLVNSWVLEEARPCRWSGPDFDALGNDVAFEELELAYGRLVWLDEDHGDVPAR